MEQNSHFSQIYFVRIKTGVRKDRLFFSVSYRSAIEKKESIIRKIKE